MGFSKNLLVQSQQQKHQKKVWNVPKGSNKYNESRTGVFTIKCFCYWLWIVKSLSRRSFLCKYYYPKSKDEQMLYLTSFKMAACLLNCKYLTTSPTTSSTYLHEKFLRTKNLFPFSLAFFHQLILHFIWNGCFFDSLFFTWFN